MQLAHWTKRLLRGLFPVRTAVLTTFSLSLNRGVADIPFILRLTYNINFLILVSRSILINWRFGTFNIQSNFKRLQHSVSFWLLLFLYNFGLFDLFHNYGTHFGHWWASSGMNVNITAWNSQGFDWGNILVRACEPWFSGAGLCILSLFWFCQLWSYHPFLTLFGIISCKRDRTPTRF